MSALPRPGRSVSLPDLQRPRMGGLKKRGPSRRPGKTAKPGRDPADLQPDLPNRRKHQRWARQRGED